LGRARGRFTCVECGAESDELATGWRAYVLGELDENAEKEVLMFCPECAKREFGPFGRDERT
jgi:hypothetical protein